MSESIFHKRIKDVLAESGWSQSELSRLVGVTPQAVHRWSCGLSIPRKETMNALSAVTGKSVSWFYSEDDNEDSKHQDDRKQVFVSYDEKLLLDTYRDLPGDERRALLSALVFRCEEIKQLISKLNKEM